MTRDEELLREYQQLQEYQQLLEEQEANGLLPGDPFEIQAQLQSKGITDYILPAAARVLNVVDPGSLVKTAADIAFGPRETETTPGPVVVTQELPPLASAGAKIMRYLRGETPTLSEMTGVGPVAGFVGDVALSGGIPHALGAAARSLPKLRQVGRAVLNPVSMGAQKAGKSLYREGFRDVNTLARPGDRTVSDILFDPTPLKYTGAGTKGSALRDYQARLLQENEAADFIAAHAENMGLRTRFPELFKNWNRAANDAAEGPFGAEAARRVRPRKHFIKRRVAQPGPVDQPQLPLPFPNQAGAPFTPPPQQGVNLGTAISIKRDLQDAGFAGEGLNAQNRILRAAQAGARMDIEAALQRGFSPEIAAEYSAHNRTISHLLGKRGSVQDAMFTRATGRSPYAQASDLGRAFLGATRGAVPYVPPGVIRTVATPALTLGGKFVYDVGTLGLADPLLRQTVIRAGSPWTLLPQEE